MLLEAARSAWNAYDADRYAEATRALGEVELVPGDPLGPIVQTAVAVADFIADRISAGVGGVRRGIAGWLRLESAGGRRRATRRSSRRRWLWPASRGSPARTAPGWHWVRRRWRRAGTAAVAACRDGGFVAWLPWALANLSMSEALAGRHAAAEVSATEGLTLARDLDQPMAAICSRKSILAWLAAVRGDEDRCRQLAADAIRLSAEYRLDAIVVIATWALGLLDLSLGRPDRAADLLADRTRGPLAVPSTRCLITPDLVEASVRARRVADATPLLDWYHEWADATGQPWALAAVHRCRALLAQKDHERSSRTLSICTNRRDLMLVRSIVRERSCCSASGCAASAGVWRRGRSCRPPWTRSSGSARSPGPNGLPPSCGPPVRACPVAGRDGNG